MTIALTLLDDSHADYILLGWAPVPGATGYRFSSSLGGKKSMTSDPLFQRDKAYPACNTRFARGATWYTVEALGIKDSGTYTPGAPPPPVGGTFGGSFLNYDASSVPVNADRFDYTIFGAWVDPLDFSHVKNALLYQSSESCSSDGEGYGLSAQQARNLNAVMLAADGSELVNTAYPGQSGPTVLGDPGVPAYREAWCQGALRHLQSRPGMKGIFADDTNRSYLALSGGKVCAKYPVQADKTSPAYEDALAGFVQYVCDFFHARGLKFVPNATAYIPGNGEWDNAQGNIKWWTKIGPYVDGIMSEYWLVVPAIASSRGGDGRRYEGTDAWWKWWQNWITLVDLGKQLDFDAVCLTQTTDLVQRDYALHSFLMDWDGSGSFISHNTLGLHPLRSLTPPEAHILAAPLPQWPSLYDRFPLVPQGTKIKAGTEYRRFFQDKNGAALTVRVDPTLGTSYAG